MKDETQAHLQDKRRIKLLNLTYMYIMLWAQLYIMSYLCILITTVLC